MPTAGPGPRAGEAGGAGAPGKRGGGGEGDADFWAGRAGGAGRSGKSRRGVAFERAPELAQLHQFFRRESAGFGPGGVEDGGGVAFRERSEERRVGEEG